MKAQPHATAEAGAPGPGWHDLCALSDLPLGSGAAALLGSQQIALFRMSNDHVFALGNIDPFSDAAVLSRGIVGDVNGELVVASPIYKQHFRLSDGSCVEDSNVSVGHYLVRVNEGRVAVRAAP